MAVAAKTGVFGDRLANKNTASLPGDLERVQKIAHDASMTIQSYVVPLRPGANTAEIAAAAIKEEYKSRTAEALEQLSSGATAPNFVRSSMYPGMKLTSALSADGRKRIEIREFDNGNVAVSLLKVTAKPTSSLIEAAQRLTEDVTCTRFILAGSHLMDRLDVTINSNVVFTAPILEPDSKAETGPVAVLTPTPIAESAPQPVIANVIASEPEYISVLGRITNLVSQAIQRNGSRGQFYESLVAQINEDNERENALLEDNFDDTPLFSPFHNGRFGERRPLETVALVEQAVEPMEDRARRLKILAELSGVESDKEREIRENIEYKHRMIALAEHAEAFGLADRALHVASIVNKGEMKRNESLDTEREQLLVVQNVFSQVRASGPLAEGIEHGDFARQELYEENDERPPYATSPVFLSTTIINTEQYQLRVTTFANRPGETIVTGSPRNANRTGDLVKRIPFKINVDTIRGTADFFKP